MSEAVLQLHIEPLEEGGFLATSPDVPGLIAQGRTIAETAEIAKDVARKLLESCIEHGDPIPAALAQGLDPNFASVDLKIPVSLP